MRRNWRRCAGTILQFQSTHSLRSATIRPSLFRHLNFVSIHALLAECDRTTKRNTKTKRKVSIHALLAECDPHGTFSGNRAIVFQSTHSLRSATYSMYTGACHEYDVSIHALLAECDSSTGEQPGQRKVSIHALLAECDKAIYDYATFFHMFQSTHSLRSATG